MPPVVDYARASELTSRSLRAFLRRYRGWFAVVAAAALLYSLSVTIPLERTTHTVDCRICGITRHRQVTTCGSIRIGDRTSTLDTYDYLAEFGEDHVHAWVPGRTSRRAGSVWGYEPVGCTHPGPPTTQAVIVFTAMTEIDTGFPGASTAQRRALYHDLVSRPSVGKVLKRAEELRTGWNAATALE